MKALELNDLELVGLIGSGESGKVYLAKDKAGKKFAVKVFEGMSIHRALLSKALGRLEQGEWPEGVLKLETVDMEERPAFLLMPFLGDDVGMLVEGERRLWNLQSRLGSHPGDQTWNLIREIADALAGMHRKRVAHGNLKPGNVFFDAAGKVQLVDWVLGNIPGVSRFGFSDALLYQAPEQLLDPDGYFEEAAYRWDVFAFGVLSYRLLTGKFPRCEEIFRDVAPALGKDCDTGIQADLPRIARGLMKEPEITWPTESGHELEKKYRVWIDQCLKLNAADRPSSMIELAKGFYDADAEFTAAQERENLMNQRLHAEQKVRRIRFFAGGTIALALILAGLWVFAVSRLNTEQEGRLTDKRKMEADLKAADIEKQTAIIKMKLGMEGQKEAKDEVKREAEAGMARLKAMNEIGDRLFEWGMEKGHRTLPVLDGRAVRLAQLEKFYEGFLESHAGNAQLADELARARLHLAEISLAADDAVKAEQRLESAIQGLQGRELDSAMRLRLGRDALLLALLKQQAGKAGLEVDFQRARKALQAVTESGADPDQVRQWLAILDFYEAKWLADKGDEAKALEQLKRSTRTLNELADARPDAAVLRSELASSYLSSATILEGLGKLADAHEVRLLAAAEIGELLKNDPDNAELMLDLAGCYGAMAEASLLSGDVTAASKLSTDAMALLDRVLKQQPESREANTRKGAQLGIQAGLLRDQGKSDEAVKAFEEGITILERQEKHPMSDYRLALLNWQKGRMLGFSGKKAEEMSLLMEADEALKSLQRNADQAGPGPEVLNKSRAYLLGDLAHALEMAKQNDRAENIYREAMGVWEALLKLRPSNEEYRSALEWSRQRVNKL
ncbi:MAG: protein kinase [Verrucomicrobiota bacterium]